MRSLPRLPASTFTPRGRIAFVASAFLLGVGGALFGSLLGTISVDTFFLDVTFMLVAMLVVGGVRSAAGVAVGVLARSAALDPGCVKRCVFTRPRS
jgi:hypothetical protein